MLSESSRAKLSGWEFPALGAHSTTAQCRSLPGKVESCFSDI